ncbi:DDB1- and CUL4-associated factor 12 [Geranomyces variabilis]|nr:DDB1- and CUL4-associated factor 12 [Geranomyces variabilis]
MIDKSSFFATPNWVADEGPRGVNIASYLLQRELGHRPTTSGRRRDDEKQALSSFISRRLPGAYGEPVELDLDGADKIFAAVWLNDNHVVLGTKCNRMCVLAVDTGRKVWIPLVGADDDVTPPLFESLIPGGGDSPVDADEADLAAQSEYPMLATVLERRRAAYTRMHGTGVRCLAINRAQTLLAVGVGKPLGDIQIYSLPTFTPAAILRGHRDMVFSLIWVSDSLLVSGARDTTVRTWDLASSLAPPPPPTPLSTRSSRRRSSHSLFPLLPTIQPTSTMREHRQKVRDMQYSPASLSLATLSADGFVKLWDAQQMRVGAAIPLRYTEETCCLAMADRDTSSVSSSPLYAVGSAYKVSVLDSRARETVLTFDSLDEGWGVRSLLFEDAVISIGGGKGRISFFDLRMPAYISWESARSDNERYLSTGAGYLERDNVIDETFEGGEFRNAVYVLSRRNGRLFAAGGPLQMSLRGSYAGIW